MKSNWSEPKRNIFAGMNDLRTALAAGQNARLVRAWNEDCKYPIRVKNHNNDFKCYEFSIGHASTRQKIEGRTDMSDFEKHLTLNYISCFGTQDAIDTYYKTGVVSADNFKGMGRSHLVKAVDKIQFLKDTNSNCRNNELIGIYERQYTNEQYTGSHFFDFFALKRGHDEWSTKKFKRKVWVVELLKQDEPKPKVPFMVKVLNTVLHPLKYIPKKRVLQMRDYKVVTFSVGSVGNGVSVEFNIPKKFSFK